MKDYPEAFDFDPVKNLLNWWKHGQLLAFASVLWLDPRRIYQQASNRHETRYLVIAAHDGQVWACVFTLRKGTYRLISCRRARTREIAAYEHRGVRPGRRGGHR